MLFVGYQDPDTIGGKLTSTEPLSVIEIDTDKYQSVAEIKKFSCFSGHANYTQIKNLLSYMENLNTVLVVHVEEENVNELIDNYNKDFPNIEFLAPNSGENIPLLNIYQKSGR